MNPLNKKTRKPVIFLTYANPSDDRRPGLIYPPEEFRCLRDILQEAKEAELCDVVERPNVTLEEIFDVFQRWDYRNRIAIFHYCGHAIIYTLLLESRSGKAEDAHASGLAGLLGQQTGLRLVFLNGCATQQQAYGLLDAGVPAVYCHVPGQSPIKPPISLQAGFTRA